MPTTAVLNYERSFFDWYLMPESFSAPLVEEAIEEHGLKTGQIILDPFSGTGTTILAAKFQGLNGVGIEVNPFLCFAARVKTHLDYNLQSLEADINLVLKEAEPRLARLSLNLPLFSSETTVRETTPEYPLPTPQMPRLYKWMSKRVVEKVMELKGSILLLPPGPHRDLCLLALAAILRPVSNMKLTPHAFGSRVEKKDAPVFNAFLKKIKKMFADLEQAQAWEVQFGTTDVIESDIRCSGNIDHSLLPADFVITSPPYLNNLDYTMQTRLELFFLDFVKDMNELRKLRKRMIISDAKAMYKDIKDHEMIASFPSVQSIVEQLRERLKDKNWGWDYAFMTAQYFGGMYRTLRQVRDLIKPGARLIVVVGESAHSGVFVPVPKIIGELGMAVGYELEETRILRTRRSSSHKFSLAESAVVLRKPVA